MAHETPKHTLLRQNLFHICPQPRSPPRAEGTQDWPWLPVGLPSPAHRQGGLRTRGIQVSWLRHQTHTDTASLPGRQWRNPLTVGSLHVKGKCFLPRNCPTRSMWQERMTGGHGSLKCWLSLKPRQSLLERWRGWDYCQKPITALRMAVAPISADGDPESQRGKTACPRSHDSLDRWGQDSWELRYQQWGWAGHHGLGMGQPGLLSCSGKGQLQKASRSWWESWGQRVKVTESHTGLPRLLHGPGEKTGPGNSRQEKALS